MRSARPRLVLTLGDPAGIGPEIVVKALARKEVRRLAEFVIVGHAEFLPPLRGVACCAPEPWRGRRPTPGRWSVHTGRASLAYVEAAVALCQSGMADAMVTAPICKAAWQRAEAGVPGHTELLAARCGGLRPVMMLVGGGLRVALATIHEPLARVPRLLTAERIVAIAEILHRDLRARFGLPRPRLAILGVNPHAGEEGCLGQEEARIIRPAVQRLQRRRIRAVGPLPADTAFHQMRGGHYDAVLAMYHDQGLGPLKTVAFETGVNVTLGLPIVRTSPDHGTAFDIAGQNRARPDSLIAAIRLAAEMVGAHG